MNSKITVLPDDVANHIAAGEVIERPASVVKELVENAIDAEAIRIDIEIGVGGKAYIRVKDNGHGMSREDACLAFERHATSKISCTADISAISTLGFRGEALPSIASVSKLKMLTQTANSIVGTRIEIHGGEFLSVMDSGGATGTYIEVNELFYKTPARLKFLKSPATELSYINSVITNQALANPHIGFTVKNNAKEQLHLPHKSDLRQRIAGLFGRDIIRELVELHESAGSLELRGFIGLPSCHRANRNLQKMFVNQRPVKDKVINHAIQQAYETLIPKRRYPVAFLFLALPTQLVDVNVHPTKMEIRFINSQAIHQLVVNGIRKTLSTALHTGAPASFSPPVEPESRTQERQNPTSPVQTDFDAISATDRESSGKFPAQRPQQFLSQDSELTASSFPEAFSKFRPLQTTRQGVPELSSLSSERNLITPIRPGTGAFSRMKPIGQFQETYILAQAGEDIVIIDQHAAHERIFYEKLKRQLQSTAIDIQQLLFPVSIDLSHREQAVLEEHLDTLRQYGLELEPFGGTTYVLKAVPALLSKADGKKLMYDIIDQLSETGKTLNIEQKFDEVLILMSCHAAIRAHHRLQEAQIIALFRQMDALELPYACPHGRPTVIKISLHDLEKKFGRV